MYVSSNSYGITFLLTSWVPQTKLIFIRCSENLRLTIGATCK